MWYTLYNHHLDYIIFIIQPFNISWCDTKCFNTSAERLMIIGQHPFRGVNRLVQGWIVAGSSRIILLSALRHADAMNRGWSKIIHHFCMSSFRNVSGNICTAVHQVLFSLIENGLNSENPMGTAYQDSWRLQLAETPEQW